MLRRKLLSSFAGLFIVATLSTSTLADNSSLLAGVEYKKVNKEQSIAPFKMKVVEVFLYTCPACYHLEPSLEKWLDTKPKNVEFELMPAIFDKPKFVFLGKAFYTLKELGILDKAHKAYFEVIHRDNKHMHTVEELAKFFSQFGVKESDFIATFNSFKVDQLVRKARQLTNEYGVEGVPSIIVNGKYKTDVPMAGSPEELWEVVDKLIKK
ncbi:MAG: thiol:disulfide interchange protein DsbA/DsbL [Gammaproteobacteria bacterium]|nr:thiol:disulfide interchange protein DsbA/DsbL [Gammaproteobacteria bacterium]